MDSLLTIPFISALVQVVKLAGMPSKYAPLVSIFFGVAITAMVMEADWTQEILIGIVLGLSASGLYSGGKTLLTK